MKNSLPDINKGITAIIGSGGKTSLINALSKKLSEDSKVIFCTTTHIFPSDSMLVMNNPTIEQIADELSRHNCVCVGKPCANGKLCAADADISVMKQYADYVLLEADGSHRLPVKAHASYEPVIPMDCSQVILVVGASGIGKTIKEKAHRPEIFCDLAKCDIHEKITCENVSDVINKENLCDTIFVNQIDDDEMGYIPKTIEKLTQKSVYYGSLMLNKFK